MLGKYRLERELGRGGMGVVYLATDTTLAREVALKVVHPSLLSDGQFAARFEREARAVAILSHPNIVHVNAFVNEGGVLGIDMPYLSGGSLREQFMPGLTVPRLVAYLVQVLRALDYCHGMGMVHRDVKPSNVLLDERGQAKLSDFGLAKLLSESFRDSMVSGSTGCFVGTPCYVPPESWDLAEAEASWDIYAAGVVAWEGLTGRLPYTATSPWQLISQMKEETPPPLRELALHASPELIGVVEWMMHRTPAMRARSAREVLDALKTVPEYVDEPETIASPRSHASRRMAPSDSWRQRMAAALPGWRRRLVTAAGVGAMLAAGAALAYAFQAVDSPLPAISASAPQYIKQRDIAARALPDLTAMLGATHLAEGTVAKVYSISSESQGVGSMHRALLLSGPESGRQRVFLHGASTLWAGELTSTDIPGEYESAGTWLETDGTTGIGFSSGTWHGGLKLLGEERMALFRFQAVRDQDRHTFDFAAAGEQIDGETDTAFALGLESNPDLAPLLFREGLPRKNTAAVWTESLLPAWVESRGVLANARGVAFELDGQLTEAFWAVRPGPVLGRPLRRNAAFTVAVAEDAVLFGMELPLADLPAIWELHIRLARADAPDGRVWIARMAHNGSGSLETLANEVVEIADAAVRPVVGKSNGHSYIECSLSPAGALGAALQPEIPWRCNAQLIDLEQQRAVLEWGSPDIAALEHGAILARSPQKAAQ